MFTEKTTVKTIKASKDYSNKSAVSTLITLGSKTEQDSQALWRTVCAMVLRNDDLLKHQKLNGFMDAFGEILIANLPDGTEVPIGEKTKKPAFRSWEVTKVRWQYANYIFNAIKKQGGIDNVFVDSKPLPTLAEVRKLGFEQRAQKKESAIQTIQRCALLIQAKLKEINYSEDQSTVNVSLSGISNSWAAVVIEKETEKKASTA